MKANKTDEEQSLEETLFGKDIVQDLVAKRLVQNIPISTQAIVEEAEDIEVFLAARYHNFVCPKVLLNAV